MPKTVEEIKTEIVDLVKSQGNQGAISLGTVLDDITELAGEGGGGGGSTPNVISISFNDSWVIDNPDDLAGFAEKAEQGELVMLKMNAFDELSNPISTYGALYYTKSSSTSSFSTIATNVSNAEVVGTEFNIDCISKTVSVTTTTYPE